MCSHLTSLALFQGNLILGNESRKEGRGIAPFLSSLYLCKCHPPDFLAPSVVVYFNQPMGAAQPVGWSIYFFLLLFPFLKVLHDFDSKMGKMDKKYCSQMLVHTNACLTPCNFL